MAGLLKCQYFINIHHRFWASNTLRLLGAQRRIRILYWYNPVNQAIELLWLNKKDGEKTKTEIEEKEQLRQIHAQCKIMHCYKKGGRQHSIGFSKHTILSEMKSHIFHREWSKVRNLFLLLLHLSTDIEPLIWRYGLILTLYGNVDNLYNISQFFKMCIGSLHSDRDLLLKNLLLFSHHKQ